jgi:hypothetical protein
MIYFCIMPAKQNIKSFNPDSILFIVILVLGMLIWHNSGNSNSALNKNASPSEISILQNSATIIPAIKLDLFQNSRTIDRVLPDLLPYKNNLFTENRLTDQKISLLLKTLNTTERVPILFFRYLLLPSERDDLPPLS